MYMNICREVFFIKKVFSMCLKTKYYSYYKSLCAICLISSLFGSGGRGAELFISL